MRILLVEDDTKFAQECIEVLLGRNHVLAFAKDAVSARRKIAEEEYDLILIDLMLPPSFSVEGLDLLKLLKLKKPHISIIMITSKAFKTTNIVSEAMKFGAADFIDKEESLFMERLLTAVEEIRTPSSSQCAERASRHLVGYVLAFVVVTSFCLLIAYLLRDFTLMNVVVLSGFLFLCLLAFVFLVASGFLDTGKIDKHQWYNIATKKVLSGPLALINSLLYRRREGNDESANKSMDSDK